MRRGLTVLSDVLLVCLCGLVGSGGSDQLMGERGLVRGVDDLRGTSTAGQRLGRLQSVILLAPGRVEEGTI